MKFAKGHARSQKEREKEGSRKEPLIKSSRKRRQTFREKPVSRVVAFNAFLGKRRRRGLVLVRRGAGVSISGMLLSSRDHEIGFPERMKFFFKKRTFFDKIFVGCLFYVIS